MNSIREDKSVIFRPSATANLMIDSEDRNVDVYPSPWQYFIQKNSSLLNGFFHRIATTEVVLTWNEPNIPVDASFVIINTGTAATFTISVPAGFYTIQSMLDFIVIELNAAATGITFSLDTTFEGQTVLEGTAAFSIVETELSNALSFASGESATTHLCNTPDLRNYRYIDFVSATLTYNQDLKDGSTAENNRDVLCRWYFAWDTPPSKDAYGYDVLQGYLPFTQRRIFSPPKQIRWNMAQPLGQLGFEVYGNDGKLLESAADTQPSPPKYLQSDWLMTLQVSED